MISIIFSLMFCSPSALAGLHSAGRARHAFQDRTRDPSAASPPHLALTGVNVRGDFPGGDLPITESPRETPVSSGSDAKIFFAKPLDGYHHFRLMRMPMWLCVRWHWCAVCYRYGCCAARYVGRMSIRIVRRLRGYAELTSAQNRHQVPHITKPSLPTGRGQRNRKVRRCRIPHSRCEAAAYDADATAPK